MPRSKSMKTVTSGGSQAERLRTLAMKLASAIDGCDDARSLPALARQ